MAAGIAAAAEAVVIALSQAVCLSHQPLSQIIQILGLNRISGKSQERESPRCDPSDSHRLTMKIPLTKRGRRRSLQGVVLTGLGRPTGPTPKPLKSPLVQGGTLFSSNVAPQGGMKNSHENGLTNLGGAVPAATWKLRPRQDRRAGVSGHAPRLPRFHPSRCGAAS